MRVIVLLFGQLFNEKKEVHECHDHFSQSWQASLSVAKGPVHMQKEEYNEFAYSTFLS